MSVHQLAPTTAGQARRRALVLVASLAVVLAGIPGAAGASRTAERTLERRPGELPGRYIVVYRASAGDPEVKTDRLGRACGFRAQKRYRSALKGFAAALSGAQLATLRADPDVDFVTPDRPVSVAGPVRLAPVTPSPPAPGASRPPPPRPPAGPATPTWRSSTPGSTSTTPT